MQRPIHPPGQWTRNQTPPRICSVRRRPEDQVHHQLARGVSALLSFWPLSFPMYRMGGEVEKEPRSFLVLTGLWWSHISRSLSFTHVPVAVGRAGVGELPWLGGEQFPTGLHCFAGIWSGPALSIWICLEPRSWGQAHGLTGLSAGQGGSCPHPRLATTCTLGRQCTRSVLSTINPGTELVLVLRLQPHGGHPSNTDSLCPGSHRCVAGSGWNLPHKLL